jgi:hypothetical protein
VIDLRDPLLYLHLGTGLISRTIAGILLAMAISLPMHSALSFGSPRLVYHVLAIAVGVAVATTPHAVACLLIGGPWPMVWLLNVSVAVLVTYLIASFGAFKRTLEPQR